MLFYRTNQQCAARSGWGGVVLCLKNGNDGDFISQTARASQDSPGMLIPLVACNSMKPAQESTNSHHFAQMQRSHCNSRSCLSRGLPGGHPGLPGGPCQLRHTVPQSQGKQSCRPAEGCKFPIRFCIRHRSKECAACVTHMASLPFLSSLTFRSSRLPCTEVRSQACS